MYSKQTSKMWSLKSIAMIKCETRASAYAVQLSDSQALFRCSVIILEMVSLNTLFSCSAGEQA